MRTWRRTDVPAQLRLALAPIALAKPSPAVQNRLIGGVFQGRLEYWLILHFVRHASGFIASSAAEDKLRESVPEYSKGYDIIHDSLESDWQDRITQAVSWERDVRRTQHLGSNDVTQCNPSSDVARLVEQLLNLSKQ
ncbi:MAG: hypothetical protein D8M59_06005 [Planctomycetes bacterium]|nr:hypothetical protein [Planctomycetota bacterium]